jgi:hypothetical protein
MLDTLPSRPATLINRFARSTFDLSAIVKQIVDAKTQFRSPAEPWADNGTSTWRLMLAVLGGLAGVERDLIRPAPPRAAAGCRSTGSTWADPRNSPTRRRWRLGNGGQKARPSRSPRGATTWARARFPGSQREQRVAMANKVVMNWLDGLEATLETESKLSGLLDHNPTIGQAREFLVRRVLKTILPAGVHIGSGKVIDYKEQTSKQIDIVLYDPRFPMLELEGGGLYFVEGALATIEVKSTIDSEQLEGSLDNCKSVLMLEPFGEHKSEAETRIKFYMDTGNLNHNEAEQRFAYKFRPATYVFGFNSKLSLDTIVECISKWWQKLGCASSMEFPLLPRVITSGNVVGVVNDGRINLNSTVGNHVMALFTARQRFRWLALHLMDAVSIRLGLRNFGEQFDYRLTDYYPFGDYLKGIEGAKFISRSQSRDG